MALPHSAWYFVHGNAAMREVTNDPVDVVPIEIGRRYGWGSQFWVTRETESRGRNIFHFPISAPLFMNEPDDIRMSYRAHIAQVAVQGDFGVPDTTGGQPQAQLRWIDVWEGSTRVFTTSEEGPDGHRTRRLNLTGDYRNRWTVATSEQDRAMANVHVIGTGFGDTRIAYRGISVSVGIDILGDRRVAFTNVGVFLMYFRER